jgi:F-type H+-transporting ATPase subunit b
MLSIVAAIQILATEEEPEGIDLILPETKELIAGIIAFSLVFLFVRLWAWPALQEMLENRRQAITGQLEEAERVKREAESLLADYQAQVAGAKHEANQIIDEARSTADSMKSEIVARAESEAASVMDRARADVATERSRAAAELQSDVANLSLDMAEKVVAGSIDRETQRALVERYLDELGGLKN